MGSFFKAFFPYLVTAFCSPFFMPKAVLSVDFDSARNAMVEDQIKRRGIRDKVVLQALLRVPRHLFVEPGFLSRAYSDSALPIKENQTISQPYIVALMTQSAMLNADDRVLEIGTGSAYQAAVLARLCRRLYSIERHPALLKDAEDRFKKLGLVNITTQPGDGSLGWPEQAPFERIMVTAAAADVPETLLGQLGEGGIMIVPVGLDENDQRLLKVRKGETDIETEDLGATRFVPLIAGPPGP